MNGLRLTFRDSLNIFKYKDEDYEKYKTTIRNS